MPYEADMASDALSRPLFTGERDREAAEGASPHNLVSEAAAVRAPRQAATGPLSPSHGRREEQAAALNAELRDASPQAIVRAALDAFPGRIALVSSFGSESAVLLRMLSRIDPSTPVLFLDTGHHFGQTLDYRKRLAAELGLSEVRDLRPAYADLATVDPRADLYKTDTDACCAIRKVAPLDMALKGFDAWITGRKRFHGGARLHMPAVEAAGGKLKFNPLVGWDKARLDAYVDEHALPPHPLVEVGYASVGCWPCTKPTESGDDVRSGRWAGSEKTECGIHVSRKASPAPQPDDVGGGI